MATKKWDDDFDPYAVRHIEHGLTYSEGLANVIKGCLGTGLLALPEAFYLAGTINGVISFLIISAFGTYCFHLLVRSQYLLCKIKKTGFLSYPKSLQAAFEVGPKCFQKLSPIAGPFVDFTFLIYQTGTLCVYLIFMMVNIKMVVDQYIDYQTDPTLILLYTFPFVLLLDSIPYMKWFSPLSIFANIVTFVTIGVLAWYVSQSLPEFHTRPYIGDWVNFPLFFGTSVFALLSVPVIITVENNMANPRHFIQPVGALNIGFGLVSVLYAIVGFMGAWRYGDKTESSVTLNFPPGEILAQVIRTLYVTAIWITYGLNAVVPRDVVWNIIEPHLKEDTSNIKKWSIDYTIRFLVVVITYLIAIFVPLLGPFISLTGGFCLSLLGISFPALLEMCALYPDNYGKGKWRLWKDIIIFLIGIFGLVTSASASIRDIYNNLNSDT